MNLAHLLLILTTICAENNHIPLDGLGDSIQVKATLVSFKTEGGKKGDGDIHLNLCDPDNPDCKMTAEIMPGDEQRQFHKIFPHKSGKPNARVTVTGLRYYDHEPGTHWGKRFKKFYIEIHPVTNFTRTP